MKKAFLFNLVACLALTIVGCSDAPTSNIIDKVAKSIKLYNQIRHEGDVLKEADKKVDDALATKADLLTELKAACDAEDLKKIEKDLDCSIALFAKHVQDKTKLNDDDLAKECPVQALSKKCTPVSGAIVSKFYL